LGADKGRDCRHRPGDADLADNSDAGLFHGAKDTPLRAANASAGLRYRGRRA
jgi:hypothetical protein